MTNKQTYIHPSTIFLVMAIEKNVFNGMQDIDNDNIKLIPISGCENEIEVRNYFNDELKNLRVIGVQSYEYLTFQLGLLKDYAVEMDMIIEGEE